ncbi:type II toxin-antitoxin system prevent-host-death family antitoxin [Nocardia grenadensis]|uniref:type II toxin-antitoxin system prevent-host-death family antitoxin n=1 Tax=Nocardia grenadensis TaxID=931537 RepID=UPI003D740341
MSAIHYDNYTTARAHLKQLLDAADEGRVATVTRDSRQAAVVDAERLRYALSRLCPQAKVVNENNAWWVFIEGVPVAADGATFDEAVLEMIDALHEYAEDWQDGLRVSVDHKENWGLVQLIELSTDEQLRDWLVGAAR